MTFARNTNEARFYIRSLGERGLLGNSESIANKTSVILSPAGWAQFENLTRGASDAENPVFVAMWFGDAVHKSAMDNAYDAAIVPAVRDAGYLVARVDLDEHNDWIMDRVLGSIRMAPFVVADFTGHRNGVYFEAGFARGLGIPVIQTCREDDFANGHFDTKQLNHILWSSSDELNQRLYHRILATIGKGPHQSELRD